MKLYTEEQVKRAIDIADDNPDLFEYDEILSKLTPIELPSDDLILAQAKDVYSDPMIWAPGEQLIRCAVYEHGAHWVIDQIKQQAKKHGKSETKG